MRKILILAIGFVSFGALDCGQSAFAGWTKKKVCEWRLTGAYIGDVDTRPLGLKLCREIDVLVPDNWGERCQQARHAPTNLKMK